jgi:hypothetical protein
MTDFEVALAELEEVTGQIRRSDPAELAPIAQLLDRRRQAIELLPDTATVATTAEIAARLGAVFTQGTEIEQSLRITRAAICQQLAELHRAGFQARALNAMAGVAQSTDHLAIDIQA